MSQIFISYRRADSQANTDRIYERLVQSFGKQAVFKDVDDIPFGADFSVHLQKTILDSTVILVVIGNTWASATDEASNLRLSRVDDFVRLEVETALNLRDATVIPVLVNNTTMPMADKLPASIHNLLHLNAIQIRNDPDFENDIERLIRNLKKSGMKTKRDMKFRWRISLVLLGFIIILSLIYTVILMPSKTEFTSIDSTSIPPTLDWADKHLVFHRSDNNQADIFKVNLSNGSLIQLTDNPADDFFPVWSPDGSQIAFFSSRTGNMEIFVMNTDGNELSNISNDISNDEFPAWSPDGLQIVFSSDRNGDQEIFVMNIDGSNIRQLTNSAGNSTSPAWSPDGLQIAFSSDRNGDQEIFVMNIDGSNIRQLTNSAGNDTSPAWSPDGSQIAFESDRENDQEIYIMNTDGTNQRNITTSSGADRFPVWSSDGLIIVFESRRDGNFETYFMASDGSSLIRMTNTPDKDEISSRFRP